ncbi:MAG: SusD/RagB family nutrient-binding outer membrane lipoprotein [Bacteroidetes bacterium]|nr:SusD/RagB family nutrient-binding outer membrane lipoprotein [Bacteroidota bacterium]
MKKKLIFTIISCFVVMSSCNDLSNNLQNPNQPLPSQGNLDLVLNSVQLNLANFYWDLSNIGSALTRMEVMFGPLYSNAFPATSYDQAWTDAYQGVLVNAKTVIDQGVAKKLYTHVGIAQTIQAYTLMTLVDFFGDVPYSKAFQGNADTNPTLDAGKDVYTAALASLDSAIANFGRTPSAGPATDVYYSGNTTKWKALANTLKLKYYMNAAQENATAKAAAVSAIQTILAGNVIDATDGSEDFQFNYGTSYTNPNSRHPKFQNNYTSTGASDYLGNWFMYVAVAEKTIINGGSTIDDPRRRYYFYRQSGDAVTDVPVTALPCATRPTPDWYANYAYWYPSNGMPFCQLGTLGLAVAGGYWGRDHGDNSGIPPDGQLRTTYGVYPAGGLFDASTFSSIGGSSAINLAGQGKGIAPIWLASFTEMMKAEAALSLGVDLSASQSAGIDPLSALAAGMSNSVTKVMAFPATVGVTPVASRVPSATTITTYYNFVKNLYTNAPAAALSSPGCKLDIVMREFYIAAYGNGIEAYNMYRRTGYPSGMQYKLTGVTDSSDPFTRTGYYPSVAVNRNSNIQQKSTTDVKTFWDPGLTLQ